MTKRNSTHGYLTQLARNLSIKFSDTLSEILPQNITNKECNKPLIRYEKQMKMTPLYSPACDAAIGPFSFDEGNINDCYQTIADDPTVQEFIKGLQKESLGSGCNYELNHNRNPRCFSAIEVENSTAKDVKHLLGSITNCSILSKIGIVIIFDANIKYAERLLQYIAFAKYVNKTDKSLFNNVFVIAKSKFDAMLDII